MYKEYLPHHPVDTIFGNGKRMYLKEFLKSKKFKVLCSERGQKKILEDRIFSKFLKKSNFINIVNKYPEIGFLEKLSNDLLSEELDVIIGIGGGSVMDTSKVLSIYLSLKKQNFDLATVLSGDIDFHNFKKIDVISIPTTFGTGSEVTPFATVWDFNLKKKLSLNSNYIYPKVAIIDPELAIGIPKSIAITTGLDAVNQAAESLWSKYLTAQTIDISLSSFVKGFKTLPLLINDLENIKLWGLMAECSLMSGLAISQTKTALCHSISYPLTIRFGIPHGLACAFTMPSVLNFCLDKDDGRFRKLAKLLGCEKNYRETLFKRFIEFNRFFDVNLNIRNTIKNKGSLISLIPEMYNPERANNLIKEVQITDIKKIILESFEL